MDEQEGERRGRKNDRVDQIADAGRDRSSVGKYRHMLLLSWINRDGKLVLLTNGIRSFAYGFVSIILLIYLNLVGFSLLQTGIIVSLILVSGLVTTILSSIYADRVGRRRFLFIVGVMMAITGLIYALTTNPILLILGALTGTLSPTGSDITTFLPLEQAMLPQSSSQERRNALYAVYNTTGQLTQSGGILLSAMPVFFEGYFHLSQVDSYRPLFAVYSALAFVLAVLYLSISSRMELQTPAIRLDEKENKESAIDRATRGATKLSRESKMLIAKFSAIIGVDALAGGFVIQTIISFWFYKNYNVPLQYLSLIFFVTGVLSSFSILLAGWLADRIGAINTMVFTHLPANLFLMAIPLAPNLFGALAFFFARSMITTMDVPARQAYTVSVVKPHERTAAAGMTSISRNSARTVSPSLSTYALQFVSQALPFFIAGSIYICTDLTLFFVFRNVKEMREE